MRLKAFKHMFSAWTVISISMARITKGNSTFVGKKNSKQNKNNIVLSVRLNVPKCITHVYKRQTFFLPKYCQEEGRPRKMAKVCIRPMERMCTKTIFSVLQCLFKMSNLGAETHFCNIVHRIDTHLAA